MTTYHNIEVEGLNIFYREAGKPEAPTLVLLHGFPSSSHMFRGLLETLADSFHLIAPDYPGYGNSASPAASEFEYSFDKLATVIEGLLNRLSIERYSLYMQDYGAPIGFRLASQHPERIERLVIQNGNIYLEGVSPALDPLQAYWQERSAANEVAIRSLLAKETTISNILTAHTT